VGAVTYSVRGSYFESCNCDAICPCRMTDGIPGGRSTYGVCFGALSWLVEEGRVGDLDVSSLAVALVVRYDDDEPGSPWTIVLHIDAEADDHQRGALTDVFLGRLGGPHVGVLPWVRKARHLVDVRTSTIVLRPEGEGYRLQSETPCGCARRSLSLPTSSFAAASLATTSRAVSSSRASSRSTTIHSRGS